MPSLRHFAALFILLAASRSQAQSPDGYHLSKTYKIASSGGWDYIAVGPDHRLYVSHSTQVNILDEKNGDSLGVIPNTTGVHGIAFDGKGKGYVSDGRLNTVTVFDLKSTAVLQQIPTGQNPDAIMYEPFSGTIITCNGRSHDLSVIDPVKGEVVATIPLEGKPETAVSDEAGKVYVNIEDKSRIAVVDIKDKKVETSWSIAPGEGPTGLAIDTRTHRLFAGCDKMLIVVDASDGHIVDKLPIGDGCDGVAFDRNLKLVFASCGEGEVSVIKEASDGSCTTAGNIPTKRSARTIAVDENNHEVFLPAADTEPPVQGQRPHMIPGTFQVLVLSRGR